MIRPRKETDRTSAVSFEELDARHRLGGVLPSLPELTDREQVQHAALDPGEPMMAPAGLPTESRDELYATVDPVHGSGGSSGHVPGEPFALDRVIAALARDRAAARAYIRRSPATHRRVSAWLRDLDVIERLARERATDPNPHARLRVYYDVLRGGDRERTEHGA